MQLQIKSLFFPTLLSLVSLLSQLPNSFLQNSCKLQGKLNLRVLNISDLFGCNPQKKNQNSKTSNMAPRILSFFLSLYFLIYSASANDTISTPENFIDYPTCPNVPYVPPIIIAPADNYSPRCAPMPRHTSVAVYPSDRPPLHFALNIEFTEAEWFLHGVLGIGLDEIAPGLSYGGPPPIDGRKANLDELTQRIIEEFAYQEVGHVRYIEAGFGGIPRPLIDISKKNWAHLMDMAFGYQLEPPFDPYCDSIHYMVATYMLPYVGINGYTGTNLLLDGYYSRRAVAGLLGVESAQDAVIREYLFERKEVIVEPYNKTVAEFTVRLSDLRNRLGMCGVKDEGLIVPWVLGAEMRICTNVISANENSVTYSRTPREILRIMYSTGDEHVPGGFWPKGGNGEIARMYLV